MESDSECENINLDTSDSGSSTSVPSSDSEEASQNEKELEDEWTEIDICTDYPSPSAPFEFIGNSSINEEILSYTTPIQFFNYYFDEQLIGKIVDETNLFAIQQQRVTPTSSTSNQWCVSPSEMRIFFAIVMAMSITYKPEEKMYWSKKNSLLTPFFAQTMSYRRYVLIKKYLHFDNNETYNPAVHPNPKLNKIWPIYESLNKKFQLAYIPERNVTIDESLMLYKGFLSWKQYIPLKRARFGIKSYFLCESKSGYIWSSLIYTGKGTIIDSEFPDLPLSSQVVINLMKPLLNKGYCVTVDNFYSSVELSDLLESYHTDIYGTVRSNRRGLPKNIKIPKKVRSGYIKAYRKRRAMVMRWKDKRDVYFLSTVHGTDTVEIEKRNNKRTKPKVCMDYNFTMGGVDRVDQHLSNYPLPRKRGRKYYKKIFFHLMEQALWNSYVLYTKNGGSMTHLEYRIKLIEEYVEKYHIPDFSSKGGRPSKTPNPMRLKERHFLKSIPVTGSKSRPTKRCVVCCSKRDGSGKRIRRESRYWCPNCEVGLCLEPCFEIYHTKLNY